MTGHNGRAGQAPSVSQSGSEKFRLLFRPRGPENYHYYRNVLRGGRGMEDDLETSKTETCPRCGGEQTAPRRRSSAHDTTTTQNQIEVPWSLVPGPRPIETNSVINQRETKVGSPRLASHPSFQTSSSSRAKDQLKAQTGRRTADTEPPIPEQRLRLPSRAIGNGERSTSRGAGGPSLHHIRAANCSGKILCKFTVSWRVLPTVTAKQQKLN